MYLPSGVYHESYTQDHAWWQTGFIRAKMAALLVVLAVIFPLTGNLYLISVANVIGYTILSAMGVQLLTGYCGQLTLGHAAFIAVGAYACAVAMLHYQLPYPAGLLLGAIAAGIWSVLFGLPSARVKGFYLIMTSMAAQFITVDFIITQYVSQIGGRGTYFAIPPGTIRIGPWAIDSDLKVYYLMLALVALCTTAMANLLRTRVGRAWIAIRDNDIAAEAMGVNVVLYKLLAFFVAGVLGGIAGAFWISSLLFVSPEHFQWSWSLWIVGVILIGGIGSLYGTIAGSGGAEVRDHPAERRVSGAPGALPVREGVRLRTRHRPVPRVRAEGAGLPMAAGQELLQPVAVLVLTFAREAAEGARPAEGGPHPGSGEHPQQRRWMMRRVGMVVCLLVAVMAATDARAQSVVKMGTLADMTGPTSDVGKDVALGMREAVQYANDTGGVNGKPIKMFLYDYGYRVPEAITTYKRFRDFDKVVAVWGWGTGDTEALSPTVNADKMPFLSDSFSSNLTDPKKTPYNFIYGTDYSTNARAALTAWYDEVWLKDPRFKADREKGVKPRFVCFYSWPTPYASAPIKAIKDQAALLGFQVGPDQDVSLTALDTKSQVLAAKNFGPHVVWHGNTTMSVATALKDAAALGLGADHLVNIWGYDENLIKLAGGTSERVIGTPASAFYGEKVPLMDKVVEYTRKMNPGVPQENRLVRTVQAWVDVLMMREALVRADKAGKLFDQGGKELPQAVRGPAVKAAFETLREWTPGLGSASITVTSADHRVGSMVRVYTIRDRKFTLLKEVDLKKRWPEKWEKEWLGW